MSKEKVGFLGPKGTFTEMAVMTVFKEETRIPFETIPCCIDAVMDGEVDYGVVPLENAIEGSVNLTIDYLIHEQPLPIVGEIHVPIQQHFMVHPDNINKLKQLKNVYSHPHAIAQCHRFLRENYPNIQTNFMNSTSAAAKYVEEHPEQCVAAIANELAAKEYHLSIVQRDVHDYTNNVTRFVILHQTHQKLKQSSNQVSEKTTVLVTLPKDYPGALHQVLSAFAWRKLNLSKIESRPAKTGLGNYFFVIDVEMKMDDVLIPGVKQELEALGCRVKILGSYPVYKKRREQVNVK